MQETDVAGGQSNWMVTGKQANANMEHSRLVAVKIFDRQRQTAASESVTPDSFL